MRTLADHILGEAVWFPNLVRGVTRNEPALPAQTYEDLKALPASEVVEKLAELSWAIRDAISDAGEGDLQTEVDLGFTTMPLWQATFVAALEGTLHNWDAHARRDEPAKLLSSWAVTLAGGMPGAAPFFAHEDGVSRFPGTYLLDVGDGIGPLTVKIANRAVSITPGEPDTPPDASVNLTADEYVRLLTGRFKLTEGGSIEGDRAKACGLNVVFAGIANG